MTTPSPSRTTPLHCRAMQPCDIHHALDIEQTIHLFQPGLRFTPWAPQLFVPFLASREHDLAVPLTEDPLVFGLIAEEDAEGIGFLLAKRHSTLLWVHRFAVHPKWQWTGVATLLFETALDQGDFRPALVCVSSFPTSYHAAWCFLRGKLGFRFVRLPWRYAPGPQKNPPFFLRTTARPRRGSRLIPPAIRDRLRSLGLS